MCITAAVPDRVMTLYHTGGALQLRLLSPSAAAGLSAGLGLRWHLSLWALLCVTHVLPPEMH